MKCLVISTSLRQGSKSAILARKGCQYLKKVYEGEVEWVNLRDVPLPMCDGGIAYEDNNVKGLKKKISEANGIMIATPIYNFSISASAKNLLELTGEAWNNKVVSFLCAGGGKMAYMSIMPYANSLMLYFRCIIVPDFVYASEEDFENDTVINEQIDLRLQGLSRKFITFVNALERAIV